MPPLTETVIIDNHPSVNKNLEAVYEYITTELDAGRMLGPYTQEEAKRNLQGPFHCSPFIVSTTQKASDLPPKKCVCRNVSKGLDSMDSVNSFINKEDFPTRFDMPSRVANAVSSISCTMYSMIFAHLYFCLCRPCLHSCLPSSLIS